MCNAGHERKRCQTRRAGNYYRAVGRKTKSCWQPAGRPSGMFRQEAGGEDRHLFHKEQLDIFSHLQLTRGKGKMRFTFFHQEHSLSVKSPKHAIVLQKHAAMVLQTVQLFTEDWGKKH